MRAESMRLRAFAAAAAVAASALALGCTGTGGGPASSSSANGGTAAAGTMAPDFSGRDVSGNTFRLSDHLGKDVVLLDFMATFCEPCKAELPHLRSMYDQNKARGLLVVGVAMDGPETVADVSAFVRRFELDFPVVLDEDSRIASLYNPKKSMPLSVLIDRSGHVTVVREGYNPGDEKLVAADVSKALGGETASVP
jgi:peroxiredoxin